MSGTIVKKIFQKPIERLDEIDLEADSDKVFNRVMECTNKLLVTFNKRHICEKIIEIIDGSKLVKFSDPRNKMPSLRKPVFNIRVDLTPQCLQAYPHDFIKEYIEKKLLAKDLPDSQKKIVSDYKIYVVSSEIIQPFSNLLMDEIKRLEKTDEQFKAMKEEIRKKMGEKDDEKLNRYIIPSIFTILVEKVEANIVKLEYIM